MLEYDKGSNIPVGDALSRSPIPEQSLGGYVHHVFYTSLTKQHLQDLREATLTDPDLQELKSVILNGWPQTKAKVTTSTTPYFDYRDELTVQDGLIFYGDCVVVPT